MASENSKKGRAFTPDDVPVYSKKVLDDLKAVNPTAATLSQLLYVFKLNKEVLRKEVVTKITNRTLGWRITTFQKHYHLFDVVKYGTLPLKNGSKRKKKRITEIATLEIINRESTTQTDQLDSDALFRVFFTF
jgi:hypothetical protein